MTHTKSHYAATKHERLLRSAFGFAAVMATAATLGVAVIAPTAVAPVMSSASIGVPIRVATLPLPPTEVSILPGTIEVVVHRSRNSRNTGPYVPAAYHPHR